ncbi:MAG: cytochrome b [Castellaniella sp.]|nr:cytochrome b [Castellaniella sp.]
MQSPQNHYNRLSIALHWLTLALLIAVYALIELRDLAPKGSALRDGIQMWHETLGLTVFCLFFFRLAVRRTFGIPPITPEPLAWQHTAARVMHWALYLFLILTPVLGWITLSAQGKVVPFFGYEWPALMGPDKAWGHDLKEIHETIGNLGYYLIGLHALAALYHHYIVGDNTLQRMLPRGR